MSPGELKEWIQLAVAFSPLIALQLGRWIDDRHRHRERLKADTARHEDHMTTLRAIHDCIDDLKGTTARYARLDAERWEEFRRASPLRPGPPEAPRNE